MQKGQKVAATSRNVKALTQEFRNGYPSTFLPLEVGLTSESSIQTSIRHTVGKFGKIDVVVNNAGYGTGGALEELAQDEIHQSFEVNFFAVIKVIQQALPYMRKADFRLRTHQGSTRKVQINRW